MIVMKVFIAFAFELFILMLLNFQIMSPDATVISTILLLIFMELNKED